MMHIDPQRYVFLGLLFSEIDGKLQLSPKLRFICSISGIHSPLPCH